MVKIKEWASTGFILTSAAGTLLHFIYGWFGDVPLVMVFGAVNESPWEHLKLLFWPVLIFSLIEKLAAGHARRGFFFSRILGACLGMAFILVVFYTYSGILGRHLVAVDISLFYGAVALTYLFSTLSLKRDRFSQPVFQLAVFPLTLFLIYIFVYFTFFPPVLPLFAVPAMSCCSFL
ncbi:MAG: hypothetical protein IJO79_06065 [Firmicutes bacterium]|nr:hypothetical protein [Bacillota bacterium]